MLDGRHDWRGIDGGRASNVDTHRRWGGRLFRHCVHVDIHQLFCSHVLDRVLNRRLEL